MLKGVKKKIKTLQRADEKSKKIWLVGMTAISMILVIGLWLFYQNLTLPKPAKISSHETNIQTKENPWNTFMAGFQTLSREFSEKFGEIKNGVDQQFDTIKDQLEKTNEFSIETESPTSYDQSVEEIQGAPLP